MQEFDSKIDLNNEYTPNLQRVGEESSTAGQVMMCGVCGRGVGASLLRIHQKQCMKKASRKVEPAVEMRSKVCKTCGKSFSVELHAIHKKTCRKKSQLPAPGGVPVPVSSLSQVTEKKKRARRSRPKEDTQTIVLQSNRLAHVAQNLPQPSEDVDYQKLKSKYDAIMSNQRKLESKLEGILYQMQPKEKEKKIVSICKPPSHEGKCCFMKDGAQRRYQRKATGAGGAGLLLPPVKCPLVPSKGSSIPYLKDMLCNTYSQNRLETSGRDLPSLIPVHKNRRVL
eukprot:TRINITY_DN16655_c0_g1_i1.p1 TRINITY_DN16655_c0_g1~~TRINITY_DN16655_c0_g1_i1.p1  ORF type:complete len:282 (+),score=58.93 TRINITY_DN16655_c0_g1_i1:69-914(+)